ncbi:MAG TPA: ATP-binding protein [Candidatus Acidoferrales bacterium]|nr:ATP-binding protein [Candidatus Acidoferrales bacterium]
MSPASIFAEQKRPYRWLDVLLLLFLAGLAIADPVNEPHKQIILLAIAISQWMEGRLVAWQPARGAAYSVLIKILLSTLLLDHTSALGINSSYYPIYYLPVVTAAVYFGPLGTLLWTTLASAAYSSYLYPALQEYELTRSGLTELALRILFFYILGLLVNRFAVERRRQTEQYRGLATELAEANVQLERAQADARRSERLAALGQLSAGLAHEIRNPLGIIKGSAEMLSRKLSSSDPLTSELAGYISGEVNRLNGLVARFLDFARPLRLERRPADIAPIIERALKSAREQYPGVGVRVELDLPSGGLRLPLDEAMAEQVFLNLAVNAIEAMGEAGGTLRVAVHRTESGGRAFAEIAFRDTGPGVSESMREQIFNPFVTTKRTGIGLGLSIVSKIVDEHGGTIHLEIPPDGGACFRLRLPMEPAAGEKPEPAEAAGSGEPAAGEPARTAG